MTDEEKAEKYIQNICGKYNHEWDYSDMEQAYLNGLAEGRKENAELKEKMGSAGYRIAELKMQIEKMKCCNNCNHLACLDEEQHLYGCIIANDCEDFKKWELAE